MNIFQIWAGVAGPVGLSFWVACLGRYHLIFVENYSLATYCEGEEQKDMHHLAVRPQPTYLKDFMAIIS